MILRAIEEVRPGMVLGVSVRNRDGHTVLGAGQLLTPAFIGRLQTLGHCAVWIDDEDTRDIPYEDPLSERARTATTRAISSTFTTTIEEARKIGTSSSVQEIRGALEDRRMHQVFSDNGLVERLS